MPLRAAARPARRWTAGACRLPPPAAATPRTCWPGSAAAKPNRTMPGAASRISCAAWPAAWIPAERSQSRKQPRRCRAPRQEMNIAAREQAQAFDQLGHERDGAERAAGAAGTRPPRSDGIKEAVKALHQGLSRLADQITATANNSAGQVVPAHRQPGTAGRPRRPGAGGFGKRRPRRWTSAWTRPRWRSTRAKALNSAQNAEALDQRFEPLDDDARLAAVEKTAQFNTNALDHALEKIETSANQRATDQVENQRRAAQHEEALHRLEDAIARLEMRLPER